MRPTSLLPRLALILTLAFLGATAFTKHALAGPEAPAATVSDAGATAPAPAATAPSVATTAPTTVPDPVDPLEHPGQSAKQIGDIYKDLGLSAAIVFVFFVIFTEASKRKDLSHWLNGLNGRLGAVMGGGASVTSVLFLKLGHQASWAAVLAAAIMAAYTILHPAPATKDPAS